MIERDCSGLPGDFLERDRNGLVASYGHHHAGDIVSHEVRCCDTELRRQRGENSDALAHEASDRGWRRDVTGETVRRSAVGPPQEVQRRLRGGLHDLPGGTRVRLRRPSRVAFVRHAGWERGCEGLLWSASGASGSVLRVWPDV